MANPTSPVDANSYRLGMLVHKASTTLTAVLLRAIAKASTSGATDVGWGGVATHVEDEAAVVSDASATPGVLMFGKRGSHVSVSTGDVGALQVDTTGALMVNIGTGSATISGTVTANPPSLSGGTSGVKSVGTSETTIVTDANCRRLRVRNTHATNVIYYSFTTGVTADANATTGGMTIEPGERDEIDIGGSKTVYFIASGASTTMPYNQLTT